MTRRVLLLGVALFCGCLEEPMVGGGGIDVEGLTVEGMARHGYGGAVPNA